MYIYIYIHTYIYIYIYIYYITTFYRCQVLQEPAPARGADCPGLRPSEIDSETASPCAHPFGGAADCLSGVVGP